MKKHYSIAILPLLLLFIAGCGPSPEEIREANTKLYKEQLQSLKQDSLELIREKYALYMAFPTPFYSITSIFPAAAHKEIAVEFGAGDRPKEPFNTFFVNNEYYLNPANPKFPKDYYKHMNNIKRLIDGEDLEWEESNKYSITEFEKFRRFCGNFVGAEYIAIERAIEIKEPDQTELIKQGVSDAFVPGYYKSLFALYRFDSSQEMLDNFILEVSNDENVEIIVGHTNLMDNLLNNVRETIQAECEARYTFSGKVPY